MVKNHKFPFPIDHSDVTAKVHCLGGENDNEKPVSQLKDGTKNGKATMAEEIDDF